MPNKVDNITNFSNQALVLQLPDGTTVDVVLIYAAAAERWVMDISYGNTVVKGVGVCCFPNLLRPWKNILPFGLSCTSNNQTDPFTPNDFSNGRVNLFLLTAEEVVQIEEQVFGVSA